MKCQGQKYQVIVSTTCFSLWKWVNWDWRLSSSFWQLILSNVWEFPVGLIPKSINSISNFGSAIQYFLSKTTATACSQDFDVSDKIPVLFCGEQFGATSKIFFLANTGQLKRKGVFGYKFFCHCHRMWRDSREIKPLVLTKNLRTKEGRK